MFMRQLCICSFVVQIDERTGTRFKQNLGVSWGGEIN